MSDDLIDKLSGLSVTPKADELVRDQVIGVAEPSDDPTEAFNLSNYKPTWIPHYLWRVTHSNSQSRREGQYGEHIVAADTTTTFRNEAEFKAAVEAHLNWNSTQPSCFLSAFCDNGQARNWGAGFWDRDEGSQKTVYIHKLELDQANLPDDVHIFDVEALKKDLGIESPHGRNEFLFLYRIPSWCWKGPPRNLAKIWREGVTPHYDPRDRFIIMKIADESDDETEEQRGVMTV